MHASYDYGCDTRSSSYSTSVMTAPTMGTGAGSLCGGASLLQPLRVAPIRCRVTRNALANVAAVDAGPPSYIYAIDHLSTKLRVPMSAVVPTQAMEDDGLVPGLCRLYMEGRCRQGQKCYQVHADPAIVQQLRAEALQTPSCCHVHGAPCSYQGFPLGLTLTLEGSVGGRRSERDDGPRSMGASCTTATAAAATAAAVCAVCHGQGKVYGGGAATAPLTVGAAASGGEAAAAGECGAGEFAPSSVMASRCASMGELSMYAGGDGATHDAASAAPMMLSPSSSYTGLPYTHQAAQQGHNTTSRHVVPCLACNGCSASVAAQQQQQQQQLPPPPPKQQPPSVIVALSSLCPTSYLWFLYKESGGAMHLHAPVSRVCREHRKGMCRFGDECNFLHICRDIDIAPLVAHHVHHGHRHSHYGGSGSNNNGSGAQAALRGVNSSGSYHGGPASYNQSSSWSASCLGDAQQQQQQQQQQMMMMQQMATASVTSNGDNYVPHNASYGTRHGDHSHSHTSGNHYGSGSHGASVAISGAAAASGLADGVQAPSTGGASALSQRARGAHGLVTTGGVPYGAANSGAGACSFVGNSASSSFAGVRSTLMASVRSFGTLTEDGGGSRTGGPVPLLRPLSRQQSHYTNPPTRQNSFCNNPYADAQSLQ